MTLKNDLTISFFRVNITQRWPPKYFWRYGCVADYRKMYTSLFNDVTNAIELLKNAQVKSEEVFVSGDDGVVLELRKPDEEDNE